jgi:hypothetical protein
VSYISVAYAGHDFHFEHTGQNQKARIPWRTLLYCRRRLPRLGHQNALKPSLIPAVRRLRKEGFLAFIDAPVDDGVSFALVRSAVDRQVRPFLNDDLKPGLTGTALQLAIAQGPITR